MSCASPDEPYATVEVSNPNGRQVTFTVRISFEDSYGNTLVDATSQVQVPAKDSTPQRFFLAGSGRLDQITRCVVTERATADY
ncbi:hypothetical protein [Streptomyces sp. CRN 30]|uniref:hypothetical protein n=1 Tax=Streptomyces sp. CRN 30 TaxID=3075613 RepID=UPI002A82D536|nr:hypothetical protein [Streptomyces sp. CRN 30]